MSYLSRKETLELKQSEGWSLDVTNVTLAYDNRLNDNQLLNWFDNLFADVNFESVLAQAKVAVVNWQTQGFQKPTLVEQLKPLLEEFGLQAGKARKISQVIWFLSQRVYASDKPVWVSRLAAQFKRDHLGEFASLFWAIKDKSRDLSMQICDFIWHRRWTGYDAELNNTLELLGKQVGSFHLPEETLEDLVPAEFAKLPEAAKVTSVSLKEDWNTLLEMGRISLPENLNLSQQAEVALEQVPNMKPILQKWAKVVFKLVIEKHKAYLME
jgi:hypothetical protein